MILSKASEYAIRAVIYIALVGRKGYTPIREISNALDISFHFLTKIFQVLTEKEYLISYRGPRGGILLAKSASIISLYDIVVAIDGVELFQQCAIGLTGCGENKPCPIHERWGPIRDDIKNKLMSATITELVEKMKKDELRLADDNAHVNNWFQALKVLKSN
ncbi:MAG: Rrf2 family transcriptional regulator [Deferribacteres bacterium]|nr:Rrf2 family transcriptional regulator [candidate division KSB1 bacterium]MCB9502113.1 Rrf2 family transcriptional regulator [Deferribacteres bacterium]